MRGTGLLARSVLASGKGKNLFVGTAFLAGTRAAPTMVRAFVVFEQFRVKKPVHSRGTPCAHPAC